MGNCSYCTAPLELKVSYPIGMYGTRGVYCSPLCANIAVPGFADRASAVRDLENRIKTNKNFPSKFSDRGAALLLIGLLQDIDQNYVKAIRLKKDDGGHWNVEVGQ